MGNNGNKVGAVAVVGGGIGGMQAALDLANSGYKVYLLEEKSAIGGGMVKLDKTFPTNDCSMCTISPKLVEVDKHMNIEILTDVEILDISGEVGNFKLRLKKFPRFVDLEKCNACGDCFQVCPIEIPAEFEGGLAKRGAIYKLYPQAIPNAAAITKIGTSPCKAACPAHIHVQGYIALASKGKYLEALKLIRKDNPFPAVCGRVCTKPCEKQCSRGKIDEPVAIDYIKRFIADFELNGKFSEEEILPEISEKRDKKIAILGAGPSGLSCAYFLAQNGYDVVVFEKEEKPGGMLTYGIPPYRLPKDVVEKEIDLIKKLGVTIKCNTTVGKDISIPDLISQYDAIFIGFGAQKGAKLGVPGEESKGVFLGLEFLKRINKGEKIDVGERVAVVGGGNVAIDAVRTALRLGAKDVYLLYRRTEEEMPADEEEIKEAKEEGVIFKFLVAPKRIIEEDGKIKAIECIRMKLGEPDESGRRRPIPITGSEHTIEVDTVIAAIGQVTDLSAISSDLGIKLTKRGTIEVDPVTYQTNEKKIFCGGDIVFGPKTVIEAIASGKEAAISIDRFLRGQDLKSGRETSFKVAEPDISGKPKIPRKDMPKLPPEERKSKFSEVQLGFSEQDVKYESERCINCGVCSECLMCVEACGPKAINHEMTEETLELSVGSVILIPGFEIFEPKLRDEYGYGRFQNVVTSLQFERILSASGPYGGEVRRPSDGKHPKKIAWIQCVGSRDTVCGRDYCSSVCCMYATKEAIIAKEHEKEIEATIFYNDIRAFGKGYEYYYESAKALGIRYIRGIISTLKELQSSKNILVRYVTEEGEIREEEFDMVVLSLGLVPSKTSFELSKRVGVALDEFGFCKTSFFNPNVTSKDGVFVAGTFEAPMDIPETVMNASAAACLAQQHLFEARGTKIEKKEYPQERDVSGEEPRIGVFVCHCGSNIARVVDVPKVVEYVKTLPNVVYAENNLYTCSTDTQIRIINAIKEHNLNRVVVASCTPRTHEPLFRETLREAGLNKYLFEMANIRDQCSWVHPNEPEKATEKAKELIRMAVGRAAKLEPLKELKIEVVKRALVIGGGLAGMTASLSLANQGFPVTLLERESELGGNLRKVKDTFSGSTKPFLDNLIEKVENNPLIEVIKNANIIDFTGYVGNFKTKVEINGQQKEINHGVCIVASGGVEYKPKEYLYGVSPKIMTQLEFEKFMEENPKTIEGGKIFVMIQCVGSREKDHLYCSRICCQTAVKNALKIKEKDPEAKIYVLFRDIRTYGFYELFYKKAREAGIIFVRFRDEKKPMVGLSDENVIVEVFDEVLGENLRIETDYLILSAAIRPHPESSNLSKILKCSLTSDGFFLEAHIKLRPLDFATDGMFVCGLAHGPKNIQETISQARGAAARASTILSKDYIEKEAIYAVVDPEKCVACLTCVRVCPYSVPKIDEERKKAWIEPAACHGCGVCAAACPRKAIFVQHYKDFQIDSKISALSLGGI